MVNKKVNEQWRQQLKEKMADYRRPAPEVSWEKIDQILDARKARKPWLWHIAAAVAVVLMITGVGYWISQHAETEQPPLSAKTDSADKPMKAEETVEAIETEEAVASLSPTSPIAPTGAIKPIPPRHTLSSSKAQLQETIAATQTGDVEKTDTIVLAETAETTSDTSHISPTIGEDVIPFIQRGRGRALRLPDNRLTAKVYFTNNLSSIRQAAPDLNGDLLVEFNNNNHDFVKPDSDSIATIHTRRGPQSDQDIRYHQPVRLGISLRYQLNENWSIESGLLYTLLVADVNNKEQRHSYIGVPINFGYQLWASRRFGLYLSAGGMIEKMLDANPWQLSLNVAIGAEYKLSDRFGLYAEPGGGYYFSNNSSIPTIYQEHPFNFNLNIGLRFNLK